MPPKGKSSAASSSKGSPPSRNPSTVVSLTTSRASSTAPVHPTQATVPIGETERVEVRSYFVPDERSVSDDAPEVNFESDRPGSSSSSTSQLELKERLERNQVNISKAVNDKTWVIEPTETFTKPRVGTVTGKKIFHIVWPTESGIGYEMLNLYIYEQVRPLESLVAFAQHLGVVGWERIYNRRIKNHRTIPTAFKCFCELPVHTSEADIQTEFIVLVGGLAGALQIEAGPANQTRTIVGGILASHEYNLFSRTDPNFSVPDTNVWYFATEAKTAQAFQLAKLWYLSCRAVQALTAMYSFNCPTFLYTQQQWKVFVEDDSRSYIYTSAFGSAEDSIPERHRTSKMDDSFLKAITICLLSPRAKRALEKQKIAQSVAVSESSKARLTRSTRTRSQAGESSKSQDLKGKVKGKKRTFDEAEKEEVTPVPTVVVRMTRRGEVRIPVRIYSREEANRVDASNKEIKKAKKVEAHVAARSSISHSEEEKSKPPRPLVQQSSESTLVNASERSSE